MPPQPPRKPNYFRRMIWLAVAVVVVFGGYSIGWFYVGSLVENEVKTALAEASDKGVETTCSNPTARGFPFRIGVYCDSVSFKDGKGTEVEAGALRSAAQVYNPFLIVGEVDSPAKLTLPDAPQIELDWEGLRTSVRVAEPLPERLSVEANNLVARPVASDAQVSAKTFEGHLRPNGADLDLAGSVGDLTADPSLTEGRVLPPLSGAWDATVKNGVQLLLSGVKDLKGQSVTIRSLSISTDPETGVDIQGDLAADQAGVIDANLMVTLRNPKALLDAAEQAFPEQRDDIAKARMFVGAFGSTALLPLKIRKGKATLGFIPIGKLPPL